MEKVAGQDLLTEVRRDIAAAERHLAELRRLEAYLLHKLEASSSQSTQLTPSVPSIEFATHNYLRGLTQADAAEIVLRDAGRPLDTPTIVRSMIARGYEDRPQRKALVSSVFAVMTKLPRRFRKVGRGMWTLADKEQEPKEGESETGRRS